MPRGQARKIIVIDPSGEGHGQGITTAMKRLGEGFDIIEIYRSPTLKRISDERPHLVFVVLADRDLSKVENRILKPSTTWELIWGLTDRSPWQVHALVPTERFLRHPRFSPLDTLALAMSGVAGIWEIASFLNVDPGLEDILTNRLDSHWRSHRTFLYGIAADELFLFSSKVVSPDWPTTIETEDGREDYVDPLYVRYCFESALALANLSIDEYTLPSEEGQSTRKYAEKLLEFQDRTGLILAPEIMARSLGYLHRHWKEHVPNYSNRRKSEMPELARNDRFPSHIPCVRDTQLFETGKCLFETLQSLDFERDWKPGESVSSVSISIARRK